MNDHTSPDSEATGQWSNHVPGQASSNPPVFSTPDAQPAVPEVPLFPSVRERDADDESASPDSASHQPASDESSTASHDSSASRAAGARSRRTKSSRSAAASKRAALRRGHVEAAAADHAGATIGVNPGFSKRPSKTDRSPQVSDDSSASAEAESVAASATFAGERYRAVDELGRGGCGVVQRAVDHQLEREVAIKRIVSSTGISEEARQQFLHEAKITSQLQHPGVVPVHELQDGDGGTDAYYVMKLLDGETLRRHIRGRHATTRRPKRLSGGGQTPAAGTSQPTTPRRQTLQPFRSESEMVDAIAPLLTRFIDVCNAVAYAHDHGVIHRDLKPANIMVGGFGETIVVDWGLAVRADACDGTEPSAAPPLMNAARQTDTELNDEQDPTSENSHRSRSWSAPESEGTVVGTPAYMSPEQARGDLSQIAATSDIYSLGVILYEIVVGHHPYAGMKVPEILERVSESRFQPAESFQPKTPKPLLAIIRAAMAATPEQRYGEAAEIAADVQRFVAGESVEVYDDRIIDVVTRWCRHHRAAAVTGVASALLLLIASVGFGITIHRAHLAEQAAHIETNRAHQDSLVRLIQARDAADTWMLDLSGTLEFYPGLQPIRTELLNQSVEQYERLVANSLADFAAENSPDGGSVSEAQVISAAINQRPSVTQVLSSLERAKCHLRLGDLHRLLGDDSKSTEQYVTASELLNAITPRVSQLVDAANIGVRADYFRQSQLDLDSLGVTIGLQQLNASMGLMISGRVDPQHREIVHHRQWLDQHVDLQLAAAAASDRGSLPDGSAAESPIGSPADVDPSASGELSSAGAAPAPKDQSGHGDLAARLQSAAVRLELVLHRCDSPDQRRATADLPRALRYAEDLLQSRRTAADIRLAQTVLTANARDLQDRGEFTAAIANWGKLVALMESQTASHQPRPDQLQALAHARLSRAALVAEHFPQRNTTSDQIIDSAEPSAADESIGPTSRLQHSDYRQAIIDLNSAWQISDSDGFYRTNLAAAEVGLALEYVERHAQTPDTERLLRRAIATYQELLRQRVTPDVLRQLSLAQATLGRHLIDRSITPPAADTKPPQGGTHTAAESDDDPAELLARADRELKSAELVYEILRDHEPLTDADRCGLMLVRWSRSRLAVLRNDQEAAHQHADAALETASAIDRRKLSRRQTRELDSTLTDLQMFTDQLR